MTPVRFGFRARLNSVCFTSTPSYSQFADEHAVAPRWLPYCSARSRPALRGAAFTGTPLVAIVVGSSVAPKKIGSPKYRFLWVASTGGGYQRPLPKPWLRRPPLRGAVSSGSCKCPLAYRLIPWNSSGCANIFLTDFFVFSARQFSTMSLVCGRLSYPHQEAASELTSYPPAIRPERAGALLPAAGAFHLDTAPAATASVLQCACIRARPVGLASPALVDGTTRAVSSVVRQV